MAKDAKAGMTAIEIVSGINQIKQKIIEQYGEIYPEQDKELTALDLSLDKKFDQLCFVKEQLEAEQQYFQNIKAAAETQIRIRERAIENLKGYMAKVMIAGDIKSIKGKEMLHSISLVAGRTKVVIEDLDKLAFQYTDLVTTIKPKTDLIKSALESGQSVAGAHLETGSDYVMIRG